MDCILKNLGEQIVLSAWIKGVTLWYLGLFGSKPFGSEQINHGKMIAECLYYFMLEPYWVL